MSNSFVENINSLANATSLATGDIVVDTQEARDAAIAASIEAQASETNAGVSELLAKDWADKGHNNPVIGTAGIDAEYSAYHWSVIANGFIGDPIINDAIVSSNYTWSSTKINNALLDKSAISHLHTGIYEPIITKNTAFNKNFTAAVGDNGTSIDIARGNHYHDEYEPKRATAGTAYNKNFGTTSGTVAEGSHLHTATYMPLATIATAYNKNFVINANAPLSTEIPRGNHIHKATGVSYDNTSNIVITSTTVQGAVGQLDARLGTIVVAEKSKITAGMTDATYNVDIITAGVPIVVNAGMTLGLNSKNALYSSGVVLNYPTAPTKLIEGQFDVTMSIEALANKAYYITLVKNGVPINTAFKAEIGSATSAIVGATTVSLSGWISGLSNLDNIAVAISNVTDATDITVYSMTVSWAGQPEGALVLSGATVLHNEVTGRDATLQHPLGSIYESGSNIALDTLLDLKSDKVVIPVTDNILAMDATGNMKDSGISITDATSHMDKVVTPTLDNIVTMDSAGNSEDGGVRIVDLAAVGGNSLNTFAVAAGVATTDAVNKGQMDGLAATYTLATTFDTHEAAANPHNTSYSDVGAAPLSHVHAQTDITGLADSLATKYTKVVTPVTGNVAKFGAGDVLVDGGAVATNISASAVTSVTFNVDGTITIVTP